MGSVDLYLGRLAATLGRRNQAIEHFSAAVDMNAALGARVWLAVAERRLAAALEPGVDQAPRRAGTPGFSA